MDHLRPRQCDQLSNYFLIGMGPLGLCLFALLECNPVESVRLDVCKVPASGSDCVCFLTECNPHVSVSLEVFLLPF